MYGLGGSHCVANTPQPYGSNKGASGSLSIAYLLLCGVERYVGLPPTREDIVKSKGIVEGIYNLEQLLIWGIPYYQLLFWVEFPIKHLVLPLCIRE